ncbi:MAG: flagellar basal body P-ring protein FlgI [Silvanigrellaceae bacterium]
MNTSALKIFSTIALGTLCCFANSATAQTGVGKVSQVATADNASVRLKDLVEFRGVRSNPLVGLGLVVGLPGTGDSKASLATNKSAANLLSRLGSQVKANEVVTKNIAAVVVTAELPAFARIGDRLDIKIAAVGDSSSLEGGTLLMTTLGAADGQTYAVAQGPVSMGVAMTGAQGGGGGNNSNTSPKTVGISQSATVEREFPATFISNGHIELSLKNADFTTAHRVTHAINTKFNEFLATPQNSGLIRVRLPDQARGNESFTPVDFMAVLEQIKVEPDGRAVVVINERTGTIISGAQVTILPVAISHGSLEITIKDETRFVNKIPKSTTVGELVRALNELGAGPKDLVSILQALDAAHALKAQLKLM